MRTDYMFIVCHADNLYLTICFGNFILYTQGYNIIMQTDRNAQLDRVIKAAETLGKVLDLIEDKATFIHDEGALHHTPQQILKDLFGIIKDSEVFNEQRIVMLTLTIDIINDTLFE